MKITITIETDKPCGGNYVALEEFEAWKREREQRRIREENQNVDRIPADWMDSFRRFCGHQTL